MPGRSKTEIEMEALMQEKPCGGPCKRVLPFSEFVGKARGAHGLASDCKDCRRTEKRVWQKTPAGRACKRRIARYPTNKAARRRAMTKYVHSDHGRASRRDAMARRRAVVNVGAGVTAEQWRTILSAHDNACACCGSKEQIEQDHIMPLARGGKHEPDNVQPLCKTCNTRKGVNTTDYRRTTSCLA